MKSRDWIADGRVLTPKDAEQVVEEYRAAYTPHRFANLMRLASKQGHKPEITAVFERAIEALSDE